MGNEKPKLKTNTNSIYASVGAGIVNQAVSHYITPASMDNELLKIPTEAYINVGSNYDRPDKTNT